MLNSVEMYKFPLRINFGAISLGGSNFSGNLGKRKAVSGPFPLSLRKKTIGPFHIISQAFPFLASRLAALEQYVYCNSARLGFAEHCNKLLGVGHIIGSWVSRFPCAGQGLG